MPDIVRNGISKSAPLSARDFEPKLSRNFCHEIARVQYKKMGADAEILVQVIDIDLYSDHYGWFHVKYGLEVNSGTATTTLRNRGHGHVFIADHGGKETMMLTDRGTVAD